MGGAYSTIAGGFTNVEVHFPSLAGGVFGLIVLGAIIGASVWCLRRKKKHDLTLSILLYFLSICAQYKSGAGIVCSMNRFNCCNFPSSNNPSYAIILQAERRLEVKLPDLQFYFIVSSD